MSEFAWKVFVDRDLFGLEYIFAKKGDGIGMHDHIEAEKHNVMVTKGCIEVYGPGKAWSRTLHAGDIMALKDHHHPHEIVALEGDTKILSLHVHGKPAAVDLTDPEFEWFGVNRTKPVTIPLAGA